MSRESAKPAWQDIVDFWFDENSRQHWFSGSVDFDRRCREFAVLHEQAVMRRLEDWRNAALSSLGLVLLLDQLSRNIYREQPQAWAWDDYALEVADEALEGGFDLALPVVQRRWFYMPYMHSEDLDRQRQCIALIEEYLNDAEILRYAYHHYDIIERFGRFPHRNALLGRTPTLEEMRYLSDGGFGSKG